jgi:hypothetical protein
MQKGRDGLAAYAFGMQTDLEKETASGWPDAVE